jgi:endonuclease III
VAVVLSAQATDSGVNRLQRFFKAVDTPENAALGEEGLREYIKSIGSTPRPRT